MTNADRLVIFLHGVGSNGANLAPIGDFWQNVLPGTVFASPDAPFPFPVGVGYQWFSIAGVTEENRVERIVTARPEFDRVVGDIIAANGFADRLDKVAFVGFSQGTIMALDAIASGRWPIGAVVGFSGRLASPEPILPGRTPVLLVHGSADTVIPPGETVKAAVSLEKAGYIVDHHIISGLPHMISEEGAALASAFLAKTLA